VVAEDVVKTASRRAVRVDVGVRIDERNPRDLRVQIPNETIDRHDAPSPTVDGSSCLVCGRIYKPSSHRASIPRPWRDSAAFALFAPSADIMRRYVLST